ncbi:MAG: hypothetical protein ACREIT_05390 [Tepidisphaeraceae bacterium]
MIDATTLKAFKYAEPFRPFEIELADGRRIVIERPENVGWSEEIETLMFPFGSDAIDWITFAKVVAVRPISKGRRRRKAS